ncbi:MAG: acetyl-CoA carboxylase biotin carboxylase subunit [Eubacterium sp.]
MFHKILIANRGEIAVRIIRACRELGITSVAVYSTADREALHTQLADEAICIGKAAPSESYLNMERILSAAIASKAEAIHPGFGFLSENAKFAQMCEQCNIAFIGTSAEVIRRMGNKQEARKTMMAANVPVVPGTKEAVYTAEDGLKLAEKIGFPVMIKAASGGGGKGMRISRLQKEDFATNFEVAQQESVNGFADDTMYIEKYIESPRHIEFQILADKYGNVVSLGERDCSIQRRHQKMIEESPSVALDDKLRREMGEVAVRAAKAAEYESAGTIEFLLDKNRDYYFMEMNTRIQVEHPVTEMVTGLDLIKEQIFIAAGEKLRFKQEDIRISGHAIECRLNAENPEKNFMPCPGKIEYLHLPGGNGIRIDSAIFSGYTIPPNYDSMIAKIIVFAKDRESAIDKMRSALGEVNVEGITTNLDYQYDIVTHPVFRSGEINTNFIEDYFENKGEA